jgi:hypothetical protein
MEPLITRLIALERKARPGMTADESRQLAAEKAAIQREQQARWAAEAKKR